MDAALLKRIKEGNPALFPIIEKIHIAHQVQTQILEKVELANEEERPLFEQVIVSQQQTIESVVEILLSVKTGFLSDGTMMELIREGWLIADPPGPNARSGEEILDDLMKNECLNPGSIDCRLGVEFKVKKLDHKNKTHIALSDEIQYESYRRQQYVLHARHFALGTTVEHFRLPQNVIGLIVNKSGVARRGLGIEIAPYVNPGHTGTLTLELSNHEDMPIAIDAGRRICQILFAFLDKPAVNAYDGLHQGLVGAAGSQTHKET